MWLPPVIIDEINDIQREEELTVKTEAMRKLVKYARVGREVNRMRRLNWSKAVPRKPVELLPISPLKPIKIKPKKKSRGGILGI